MKEYINDNINDNINDSLNEDLKETVEEKKKGFQMPCEWMILISIIAMIISPFICSFVHMMAVIVIGAHVIGIAWAILTCREIEKCAGHMHWF